MLPDPAWPVGCPSREGYAGRPGAGCPTLVPVRIPFRLVDVFTDRPLAGNQLCVVPDPVDIDKASMQAIAREIGFSETTFVTEVREGGYSVRIFTPTSELPFAGHPTLGTAYVMVSEGRVATPLVQTVQTREIPVEVDVATGTARMRQLPPRFGPTAPEPDAVIRAVGLTTADLLAGAPMEVVSTGLGHLMVPVGETDAVSRAVPDTRALLGLLEPLGTDAVYLFALAGSDGEPRVVKARLLTSDLTVPEDPATGSAAGPLGAYLVEHGLASPGAFVIHQGEEMGRPSTLHVEVVRPDGGWEILVGGGVRIVGRGEFDLPL
jgi:trans-2,3-dihydro-3-hydroxyanthranilate isomerase